jgi:trans-aconitate 2-methyltransferase
VDAMIVAALGSTVEFVENSSGSHYTFGDQGPAAERLRRLAALYRPLSVQALEQALENLDAPVSLAIDLGSGPGYTTEMVAEVTAAPRAIGFERSLNFCAEARSRASDRVEFVEHDVNTADLPCVNVDLAFCRFLLTHLPDPTAALHRWRQALRPGGALVLIELERLTSTDPSLARYYEIINGVQADQNQRMFIGDALEHHAKEAGYTIIRSQPVEPGIPASAMATLHRPNLEAVRKAPWVKRNFKKSEVDDVAAALDRIAGEKDRRTPIESFLRVVIALRSA